ncbi:hypothetical protein Salat_2616500 [Sesamum alatum]|uniref:Uncharacterized protein n=1 Tax=Sesamum alatum TaxID=300844 RepID=A0AAE1XPF9_9LAMI|nr:hypothetical protein Salat_2616500 [Sesamum alatum]
MDFYSSYGRRFEDIIWGFCPDFPRIFWDPFEILVQKGFGVYVLESYSIGLHREALRSHCFETTLPRSSLPEVEFGRGGGPLIPDRAVWVVARLWPFACSVLLATVSCLRGRPAPGLVHLSVTLGVSAVGSPRHSRLVLMETEIKHLGRALRLTKDEVRSLRLSEELWDESTVGNHLFLVGRLLVNRDVNFEGLARSLKARATRGKNIFGSFQQGIQRETGVGSESSAMGVEGQRVGGYEAIPLGAAIGELDGFQPIGDKQLWACTSRSILRGRMDVRSRGLQQWSRGPKLLLGTPCWLQSRSSSRLVRQVLFVEGGAGGYRGLSGLLG